MSGLVRLSISIEKPLLDQLRREVKRSRYTNRSEFIRDLIRQRLVGRQWQQDRPVVGTVTLVYDHHVRQLSDKLTHLQHHHHHAILATTHVHLDEHLCVEVLIVKAKASHVAQIADQLRRQKGVLHAELSMTTTGSSLR